MKSRAYLVISILVSLLLTMPPAEAKQKKQRSVDNDTHAAVIPWEEVEPEVEESEIPSGSIQGDELGSPLTKVKKKKPGRLGRIVQEVIDVAPISEEPILEEDGSNVGDSTTDMNSAESVPEEPSNSNFPGDDHQPVPDLPDYAREVELEAEIQVLEELLKELKKEKEKLEEARRQSLGQQDQGALLAELAQQELVGLLELRNNLLGELADVALDESLTSEQRRKKMEEINETLDELQKDIDAAEYDIGFFGQLNFDGETDMWDITDALNKLEAKISALEEQINRLKDELRGLQADNMNIEMNQNSPVSMPYDQVLVVGQDLSMQPDPATVFDSTEPHSETEDVSNEYDYSTPPESY